MLRAHMLTPLAFYNSFTTFKITNHKLLPTTSRSGMPMATDNMYAQALQFINKYIKIVKFLLSYLPSYSADIITKGEHTAKMFYIV